MTVTSISQLKTNPARVIASSYDYPVAVQNRNKVQAYLVGKELFEKMLDILEDKSDRAVVKQTDFSKGNDFEKIAQELDI